ncbi:MAG: nitrous oxide reductase family maturation protein NosD [Leptospiraceae bacterium]|nr:nitrous oxide reductase family maturation protein NosD [Leptospiraceae bacterium]
MHCSPKQISYTERHRSAGVLIKAALLSLLAAGMLSFPAASAVYAQPQGDTVDDQKHTPESVPIENRYASGNTLRVCAACDYKTLASAVTDARAYDTILIADGVYTESGLHIDRPLRIIGNPGTVLDGGERSEHIILVTADDVIIQGLTIRNGGSSYIDDLSGIRVEYARNCVIRDNRILKTTYAIYLARSDDCLIENNEVSGDAQDEVSAGNGIHLWYVNNVTIRNNRLAHHRDGFYFEFADDCRILNNHSAENIRYGMHFMFSHRNVFRNNTFLHNQTGVAIMYSRNLVVERNRFLRSTGNAFYGMLLKEITDSDITGNSFEGNTIGIMVEGANRNRFHSNRFIYNGWAAQIYGNSHNNSFYRNEFISNHFDISTNSPRNSNVFKQNYWSDYTGYDLNRDGLGDIPFRPVRVFGFWISHYPTLSVLLHSPVIQFLEIAERAFPVITPPSLQDNEPAMRPWQPVSQTERRQRQSGAFAIATMDCNTIYAMRPPGVEESVREVGKLFSHYHSNMRTFNSDSGVIP